VNSLAVVFAGQGAQFVGMGRDLAQADPACQDLFLRADEVLGYPLSKLCFEGPIAELTKSNHCQPAVFVTAVACYRALCREAPGLHPSAMAGLSLGEWSALHAAGALGFDETLRILAARGRLMQAACEERAGGMVSVIGLPREKLDGICAAAGVEIANLNSPEQTVLSGEKPRIHAAEQLAQAAGAKRTVLLPVAGAFHSSLMAAAAAGLADALRAVRFEIPAAPVVSNVTGRPHGGPEDMRRDMVRQVTSPVQWVECVQWCRQQGVQAYVECGPGKVLSGLIKRIDKEAVLLDVQDVPTLRKTAEALRGYGGA